MKREYPMTVAQEAVLSRLGLVAKGYESAKALLEEIGLEVESVRKDGEKRIEVFIKSDFGGGFNAAGEGETWNMNFKKVDLEPIREWIVNPERMPKQPEPTPPAAPETDADNGYDFERDEELQAEIDADAALNDEEAEYQEEAAIAASPRTWGGHRDNAGRPKSERSEPLYQAGYQAGYKAGYRSYEERLGMSYRAIMHIVMNADISEEQRAQILENIKKDKELKSNG